MRNTLTSRPARLAALLAVVAGLTVACDKAQLLAPTNSTISVSAPTRTLPLGGSTEITAYVIESAAQAFGRLEGMEVMVGHVGKGRSGSGACTRAAERPRGLRLGLASATLTAGPGARVAREPGQGLTAAAISDVVRVGGVLAVFPRYRQA